MPLFTVDDARKLWDSIENESEWFPTFLHCGPFDYRLEAIPLKTTSGVHHLWIPVEWKFALRFLNHTLRGRLMRMGKYGEHLRSGFFDEVLEYWYPPSTKLPTNEEPTRQTHPLHSCYLTNFLVNMFNTGISIPAKKTGEVELAEWQLNYATFDWEKWATKRPVNRALYGALPPAGTEEYERLLEENKLARIPNTPSVEIDSNSWSQYASHLTEDMHTKLHPRRHSAMPAIRSQPFYAADKRLASSRPPKKRRMMI